MYGVIFASCSLLSALHASPPPHDDAFAYCTYISTVYVRLYMNFVEAYDVVMPSFNTTDVIHFNLFSCLDEGTFISGVANEKTDGGREEPIRCTTASVCAAHIKSRNVNMLNIKRRKRGHHQTNRPPSGTSHCTPYKIVRGRYGESRETPIGSTIYCLLKAQADELTTGSLVS